MGCWIMQMQSVFTGFHNVGLSWTCIGQSFCSEDNTDRRQKHIWFLVVFCEPQSKPPVHIQYSECKVYTFLKRLGSALLMQQPRPCGLLTTQAIPVCNCVFCFRAGSLFKPLRILTLVLCSSGPDSFSTNPEVPIEHKCLRYLPKPKS